MNLKTGKFQEMWKRRHRHSNFSDLIPKCCTVVRLFEIFQKNRLILNSEPFLQIYKLKASQLRLVAWISVSKRRSQHFVRVHLLVLDMCAWKQFFV